MSLSDPRSYSETKPATAANGAARSNDSDELVLRQIESSPRPASHQPQHDSFFGAEQKPEPAMSWRDLVGQYGECVSLEHYGASAPYQVLFEQFGFTPDRVVAAARASLSRAGVIKGSTTGN